MEPGELFVTTALEMLMPESLATVSALGKSVKPFYCSPTPMLSFYETNGVRLSVRLVVTFT